MHIRPGPEPVQSVVSSPCREGKPQAMMEVHVKTKEPVPLKQGCENPGVEGVGTGKALCCLHGSPSTALARPVVTALTLACRKHCAQEKCEFLSFHLAKLRLDARWRAVPTCCRRSMQFFGGDPLSVCLLSPVASRQLQRCWPKIRSRPSLIAGIATTRAAP